MQQVMGQLPLERVQPNRAFVVIGIDFCGPFYYTLKLRKAAPVKCYICLFVCFATKAVHLEAVMDISTNSFIAALKRFTAMRGKPKIIWSDNATNFVGANNQLRELKDLFFKQSHLDAVHHHCLADGIEWKFIPPRSPHFGGLWESSIKSFKYYFKRVAASSILTFEELRTLVCQCAAIMNSRPLCPLTENIEDFEVLTPGHFLQ